MTAIQRLVWATTTFWTTVSNAASCLGSNASPVITLILTLSFAAQGCTPYGRKAPATSLASENPTEVFHTLMDPLLWQPAGSLLSSVFPGTDASWLSFNNTNEVWTLPGMSKPRGTVSHYGKNRVNHMQYTVATRSHFSTFQLSFDFRFEEELTEELPLSWIGNSGIYLLGLYEVQIFRTGFFLPQKSLPSSVLLDGNIVTKRDNGKALHLPLNQFLCGSIYGGAKDNDPKAGAPSLSDGSYANFCADDTSWHRVLISFLPPLMDGKTKKRCAVVAVEIDGQLLHYGSNPYYVIPRPTGSLHKHPDLGGGPLVIQDHGSKVSFRRLAISTWQPSFPPEALRAAAACAAAANVPI